jgi:hypothetical protein
MACCPSIGTTQVTPFGELNLGRRLSFLRNAIVMRLNIISDLHLSLGTLDIPKNDADMVILAGDIARPREAVSWARGFTKPVLYVLGNHEFYGGSIAGTGDELKRLCAGPTFRCSMTRIITDALSAPFWTDFGAVGEG